MENFKIQWKSHSDEASFEWLSEMLMSGRARHGQGRLLHKLSKSSSNPPNELIRYLGCGGDHAAANQPVGPAVKVSVKVSPKMRFPAQHLAPSPEMVSIACYILNVFPAFAG